MFNPTHRLCCTADRNEIFPGCDNDRKLIGVGGKILYSRPVSMGGYTLHDQGTIIKHIKITGNRFGGSNLIHYTLL